MITPLILDYALTASWPRGSNLKRPATPKKLHVHTVESAWILVATIHFSPFTCCFRKFFRLSQAFFHNENAKFTDNSYVRYSLSRFTGEWFADHSNHIHRSTRITRIVATKVWIAQLIPGDVFRWNEVAKQKWHLQKIILAPAKLQKCVGGFLLYKIWRIFPGIFLEEDFSGHFFPQKWQNEKKNAATNPRKNPAAQK